MTVDLTGYKLTFDEEFDSASISQGSGTVWSDIRPYWRMSPVADIGFGDSAFVDSASGIDPFSLQNGALEITAVRAGSDIVGPGQWASGLISTQYSFAQEYGYFEMRAMLPTDVGVWPAFWMLPADQTSPAELDVFEAYGGTDLFQTVRTNGMQNYQVTWSNQPTMTSGYHTFGVMWDAQTITFYFDGDVTGQQATPADMHTPMYLLADLAMQNLAGVTNDPKHLYIDYIRAYSQQPIQLTEVGNHFFLNGSGGSGPSLKQNGADVIVGQFGAWTPIGAVQTATGYDVAWKNGSANQYTVWTTDSNGNFLSYNGVLPGNDYALESLEPTFGQDLNGDGTIGLTKTVIKTDFSTSLTAVANRFFLYDSSSGSGPSLKQNGADVVAGQFGAWNPIGAVQTATGYDVAWKNGSANQYTVWTTDSNGNFLSYNGILPGNDYALESLEPTFNQDLNGDGTIGLTKTVIRTDFSTSLTAVANRFFLYDSSSGSGPSLKQNGADVVAGQFGAWTPIGAVQTATGYDVAWKNGSASQYTIWTTDRNGNFLSYNGILSGTDPVLESFEPTFGQDLNGDGVIGLYASPGSTLQITRPLSGASGSTTIGAGATLIMGAANSASVTFASSTGALVLPNCSAFSATIFGFTGNGTLSRSDQIDLTSINFSSVHQNYAGGTLTVTDGANVAQLNFNGSYAPANFKLAPDGNGGTIVYDPPANLPAVPTSGAPASATIGKRGTDVANTSFAPNATLGYSADRGTDGGTLPVSQNAQPANLALLAQSVATSFKEVSSGQGTFFTDPPESQQSLLTQPRT